MTHFDVRKVLDNYRAKQEARIRAREDALTRHGYPLLPPRGMTGPPEQITYTIGGHYLRNRVCYLDGIEIDGHEPSDLDPNGGCIHCGDAEPPREDDDPGDDMNHLDPGFDQWCIIELFGHRRAAGHVTQAVFPAGWIALHIPAAGDQPAVTQLYNPTAVYALHPVTEAMARAADLRPQPIERWEIPGLRDQEDNPGPICDCCRADPARDESSPLTNETPYF